MDQIRPPFPIDLLEATCRAEHLRNLADVAGEGAGEGRRAERATGGPHPRTFGRRHAEVEVLAQAALEDRADIARVPAAAVLMRMEVGEQDALHCLAGL